MTKPDHAAAKEWADGIKNSTDPHNSNLAAAYLDLTAKHKALRKAAKRCQDIRNSRLNIMKADPFAELDAADAALRKLLEKNDGS